MVEYIIVSARGREGGITIATQSSKHKNHPSFLDTNGVLFRLDAPLLVAIINTAVPLVMSISSVFHITNRLGAMGAYKRPFSALSVCGERSKAFRHYD